jgi:hypothetical protein
MHRGVTRATARGTSHFPGRVALGLLASLLAAGCHDLTALKQEAPSRIRAGDLGKPENAPLMVLSAIGDFECAYTNYVMATGLVSDELINAQTDGQSFDYDRRTVFPAYGAYAQIQCGTTSLPGLYTPLSIALFEADDILAKLQTWTDDEVANRSDLIAQAAAYAGYNLVLFGEVMCSGAINGSPELTPTQLLDSAEARFTTAIAAAQAANDAQILNLALLGRARARLDLGRYGDARDDAVQIPEGFVFNATYSSVNFRRENLVNTTTYRGNYDSVDPSFRNVTFGGSPDPRVGVVQALAADNTPLNGQDRQTPLWRPTKYPTSATPIPIARWAEAQLIIAEADLNGAGDPNEAVTIINALHAAVGLPAYDPDAEGAATVQDQVIDERRREFFLEGHRLGDMIRYGLALDPAPGTPYPKGGFYGSQLCFPLPDVERNNNPNISGS